MDEGEIQAVSLAVLSNGRFLLVRRGNEPAKGLFAFPGGRVEGGEATAAAVRRELYEETGLTAGEVTLFREVTFGTENGRRYRLQVFQAHEVEGIARAGDDADLVGWYRIEEMRSLPITESTLEIAEDILARSTVSAAGI